MLPGVHAWQVDTWYKGGPTHYSTHYSTQSPHQAHTAAVLVSQACPCTWFAKPAKMGSATEPLMLLARAPLPEKEKHTSGCLAGEGGKDRAGGGDMTGGGEAIGFEVSGGGGEVTGLVGDGDGAFTGEGGGGGDASGLVGGGESSLGFSGGGLDTLGGGLGGGLATVGGGLDTGGGGLETLGGGGLSSFLSLSTGGIFLEIVVLKSSSCTQRMNKYNAFKDLNTSLQNRCGGWP